LQSRKNPITCNTLNLLNVKFVGYITLIAKSRPIKPNFLLLVLSYFLFDNLWIFSNFSYFWCCKPIDTRRQGSPRLFGGLRCGSVLTLAYPQADMTARNYAVFLFVKKPCSIDFWQGFFLLYLDILTFGCSSVLHYALRDLNLMLILTFGFPTYCSVGV